MSLILYKFETQVLWTTCLCPPPHQNNKKIHHVEIKPLEDYIQRCGLWKVIGLEKVRLGNERRVLKRRERDQSSLYVP